MKTVAAGFLMADSRSSVDPSKAQDELFELWSIPAYDRGAPDLVLGVLADRERTAQRVLDLRELRIEQE